MDERIEKEESVIVKEDEFAPPTPPPESDWRLGKYFDEMENIEGYPEPPEFEEIGGYLSNCTDTDMDESASVLYAYNYLKEYVKHMKSAKEAKNNLMLVLPTQEGMVPNYKQDSDTSPGGYQNAQGIHRNTPKEDSMDDCYDHLSTKEETYYASMKMRPGYKPPHQEVRRTTSEGPEKIDHRNGYAIPYMTRHCTLPPNLRPPIQGTVSCNYPDNKPRREQAEVVEICSPSDTSFCSTPCWVNQRGTESRIVYESIDKLELRNESDEYFIPRIKEKQSTTDSSNSHHKTEPESSRTNQKRRKSKRPNNRNKVYVTTNRVFHQPIIHSKECLDSLNSDEVSPCDCLKTVRANQKKSQHSPLKQVHVMESIQDGEISNFNTIMKKKLDRTRGVDDWTVPYPDFAKHKSPSSNNSSDNTYADDFDTYDRASNHAYASRSLTSYTSSQGNGSTNDSNSIFLQSYTHQPYSPNKETFDDKSEEMSRSMMYMPSERWNFAFTPHTPVKNGKPSVTRYNSHDIASSSDNKSVERIVNSGEFKSNSSFVSKTSSKSDRSSSCSSRGSSSTSEPKERKQFPKGFFKTLSPKLLKPKNFKSPARGQVSEL